jgi:hypothetical protein
MPMNLPAGKIKKDLTLATDQILFVFTEF